MHREKYKSHAKNASGAKARKNNSFNNNRKRNRSKRSNKRRHDKRVGAVYLPQINQRPIQKRCFRYANDGASVPDHLTFQTRDLRNMLGFVTSGATTFYPFIDSFKLCRIGATILPSDATGGAAFFTFSWRGDNAPQIEETILIGNTTPDHVSFYPPEGSTAWFWHDDQSANENLFDVSTSNPTHNYIILDIELEYIINDGALTSQTLNNAAAFTGIAARHIPIATENFHAVNLSGAG
jgi:hypothetical protein